MLLYSTIAQVYSICYGFWPLRCIEEMCTQ